MEGWGTPSIHPALSWVTFRPRQLLLATPTQPAVLWEGATEVVWGVEGVRGGGVGTGGVRRTSKDVCTVLPSKDRVQVFFKFQTVVFLHWDGLGEVV